MHPQVHGTSQSGGRLVHVQVPQQEYELEEERARAPHGRRATEEGQHDARDHRLDHEEEAGTEEGGQREEGGDDDRVAAAHGDVQGPRQTPAAAAPHRNQQSRDGTLRGRAGRPLANRSKTSHSADRTVECGVRRPPEHHQLANAPFCFPGGQVRRRAEVGRVRMTGRSRISKLATTTTTIIATTAAKRTIGTDSGMLTHTIHITGRCQR